MDMFNVKLLLFCTIWCCCSGLPLEQILHVVMPLYAP
jgi:hypothetical protein